MNKDREITFEITRHIGTIGEQATGFKKELNLVNWNGNQPKYDVRSWDPEHISMTRGITLTEEEAKALYGLLDKEFSEEEPASDEMGPEL